MIFSSPSLTSVVSLVLAVQMTARSAEPPATLPVVRRILFLGNSITRHGPKPDIGWAGNWGMAATAADKDYVHVIATALAAQTGTAPEVMVDNISDFERTPETFDFKTRLEKPLAFKAEIIVVAIGENVPAPRTDAAKAAFREHFQQLLATLKGKDGPAIFVRSCFWPDPAKDEILKQSLPGGRRDVRGYLGPGERRLEPSECRAADHPQGRGGSSRGQRNEGHRGCTAEGDHRAGGVPE